MNLPQAIDGQLWLLRSEGCVDRYRVGRFDRTA
jgi:hypothetical protein